VCSSFALAAPPLRQSTRDFAYPANAQRVQRWLRTLDSFPDSDSFEKKCGSDVSAHDVRILKPVAHYDAPGGAWVMELMLRAGMYAPMETRLFHHIISVRVFAIFCV
jgi:hypothetical protein